MTTREHFNKINAELEESDFSETYCNILEYEDLNEIRPLIEKLYDELKCETDKPRSDSDFYDGVKNETFKGYDMMKSSAINTDDIREAKSFATAMYDALIIEKLRTYAYQVFLAGGINHYVQFASDLQDCYLDTLKDDGLYSEWRGSEYADVDCRIGDGLKLDE